MARNFREALTGSERNISSNERMLSLAFGASLLGYGFYRRDAAGIASLLLSVALCDRGIRGHCAISEMMGRNSAESREQAERQVEARYALTIDKPSEVIRRRFIDAASLKKIISGGEFADIAESHSLYAALFHAASAHAFSQWADNYLHPEITTRADDHIEWHYSQLLGSVWLRKAPVGRGTEVAVSLRPNEPFRLTQRFTAYLAAQTLRRGLRQLKQQLEGGDIRTIVGQPWGRPGGRDLRNGMTLAELSSLT